MPAATISEAIAAARDRLTLTERRIAEAIVDEPTLLAFGTVSDLAARIGTSRPSIVRFANKLGFDGYPALQAVARRSLSQQLGRPGQRVRDGRTTRTTDLETLTAAISALGGLVGAGELSELAPRIAAARAVWIASGETSRAAAHALRSGLGIIRGEVHLLDDHGLGRELASAGSEDIAIISDFPRYRRSTMVAARALSARGVPIVAITDGPLSPLASLADTLVAVTVPAIGPFDSSVPTVALMELLVAEVAQVDRDSVRARVDATEKLWSKTETFVADS